MRLVMYFDNGTNRFGMLLNDKVYDCAKIASEIGLSADMSSLSALLFSCDDWFSCLEMVEDQIRRKDYQYIPFDKLKFLSPVTDPEKVLGVALNYRDFCIRGNLEIPKKLKVFGKYRNAICASGDEVDIRGRNVTYEGEIGVVIGKKGKNIPKEKAMDHIAGYTVINDFTANDLTKEDVQLFRGKNFDGFLPMGPVFVTKDEIDDIDDLCIVTSVDGEVRQDSKAENMIFKIPEQIEFFSSFMTLEPGDVILSGTPAGTATQFSPPKFLQDGQIVSVKIDGICTLTNKIVNFS